MRKTTKYIMIYLKCKTNLYLNSIFIQSFLNCFIKIYIYLSFSFSILSTPSFFIVRKVSLKFDHFID